MIMKNEIKLRKRFFLSLLIEIFNLKKIRNFIFN